MPRFAGHIGYGEQRETRPGVWESVITERPCMGDVEWANRRYLDDSKINSDVVINNSLSVVADSYANDHFMNIKYVVWKKLAWTVSSVEVKPPRLVLYIGEPYHGPKAEATAATRDYSG